MPVYFCDLHIHIGRASSGTRVKVTGAKDLTFANIVKEATERKGIDILGIVDCASPAVLKDIERMLASGELVEQSGGGLRYHKKTTVILGAELETTEPNGGTSHHISYFPTFRQLQEFSCKVSALVTNLDLSSQRMLISAQKLFELTDSIGGTLIPAHAFTPHKSLYGNCARRLSEVFKDIALAKISAIELGLSADTDLADRIGELNSFAFVSNSDAHSLPKIAREYNVLELTDGNYTELLKALRSQEGRRIVANFGLDPRLGKYHRTYCPACDFISDSEPPAKVCSRCGTREVVVGVLDRIVEIQEYPEPKHPEHRPPYYYQIPLQFVPKVGAVTLHKLLNRFGTEMTVLHFATLEELKLVVSSETANNIIQARQGQLKLIAGGGGKYGRAITEEAETQLSLPM